MRVSSSRWDITLTRSASADHPLSLKRGMNPLPFPTLWAGLAAVHAAAAAG